jgi:hypothetical protein
MAGFLSSFPLCFPDSHIIFIYPRKIFARVYENYDSCAAAFFQKYFIKGVMIGSLKG